MMTLRMRLKCMGPPVAKPPRVLQSTRVTFATTTALVCDITYNSYAVTELRYESSEGNVVVRTFEEFGFDLVVDLSRLINKSLKAAAAAAARGEASTSDSEKMALFFRELLRATPHTWPTCAYEQEEVRRNVDPLFEPKRAARPTYKNTIATLSILMFDVLTLGSKFSERELVLNHGDYLVSCVAYHYRRPEIIHDRSSRYVDTVDTNAIACMSCSVEHWKTLLGFFYNSQPVTPWPNVNFSGNM